MARIAPVRAVLAAALALAVWPVAAVPAGDGAEAGLRRGAGDDFVTTAAYVRWRAESVERLLERHLPAGVRARWDLTVAHWDGPRDDVHLAAFGPVVGYALGGPWRLSLGVQPTLLSRNDGNGQDLGGPVQFTSHVGLRWRAGRRLTAGLRIQHTSNAHLYTHNPGVDMWTLGLGWRF